MSLPRDPGDDPLGISRFQPAPVTLDRWPAPGWLPARSVPGAGEPAIDWAWFGDRALREPLFEDSVRRATALPLSRALRTRTDLPALIGGADGDQSLEPDGFVFHMSRCGSTLVAQMLAAVPHHIVASEPAPLDDLLQWAVTSDTPLERKVAALRAVVRALGRNRTGNSRRFFLKLEAWSITALPLVRAAFPSTPWIFLYRKPEEVMVSHVGMPGMHFAAGAIPGIGQVHAAASSTEDLGAAVLARYLAAGIEHAATGGGRLIDYADLRDAMLTTIPAHFGFEPSADERAAMSSAANRNAKAPDRSYADDTAEKRARLTPAILAAVERHLREPYSRIDALQRARAQNAVISEL